MKTLSMVCAIVATASGCATSFTGSAHVEGGRAGCERKCAGDGLTMQGLVYMGEYSSACVCAVPGSAATGAAASAGGGAVGVVMQMRRQQEEHAHGAYY